MTRTEYAAWNQPLVSARQTSMRRLTGAFRRDLRSKIGKPARQSPTAAISIISWCTDWSSFSRLNRVR